MNWTAEISSPKRMNFVIEQQLLRSLKPGIPDQFGFYIYVYENGRGIADYLQDTLEIAKSFTQEKFGVSLDAWKQTE